MHNRSVMVWLLGLTVFLLFFRLGSTGLFQVAEARNAECAREMMVRKDWIVPTFNDLLRTDKPVFQYWAMMLAYLAGGITEGSARFFSAVCGLATFGATFFFVRRHFNFRTACLTILVLLASAHTITQFRLATPDPYLIFCHTASLYCFWEGWTSGRLKWYAAMYMLWGIGLLVKGPVAVVIPALTLFLYLLLKKKLTWPTITSLKPLYGVLLVGIISLPWYGLVGQQTQGAWMSSFLLTHNVSRFQTATDQHGGFFLLTPLFVVLGMFPFSVFFIRSVSACWQQIKKNEALLFVLISFLCVVVFYCFSRTRLINYTTPAYPFFAIITAFYLNKFFHNHGKPLNLKPELLTLLVISFLIPVGLFIWLQNTTPFQPVKWQALLFMFLPAGMLMALRSSKWHTGTSILWIAGTYAMFALLVNGVLLPALDQQTPLRKRQQLFHTSSAVVAYQNFNDEFVFYARRTIPVYPSTAALQHFIKPRHGVLVLARGKDFTALDTLKNLECISKDKEIFSSQYAAFYWKK